MNKLLRYKLFARFLVMFCLLLYTSTGQAFWCTEAKGVSHLELNSIGACNAACHPDADKDHRNPSETNIDAIFSAISSDCFDVPAYDSVISSSKKGCSLIKPNLSGLVLSDPFRNFIPKVKGGYLRNHFPEPHLPPLLASEVLRTVVLLR